MRPSTEVANPLATSFARNASGDVSTFDEVVSEEEAVLAIGSAHASGSRARPPSAEPTASKGR